MGETVNDLIETTLNMIDHKIETGDHPFNWVNQELIHRFAYMNKTIADVELENHLSLTRSYSLGDCLLPIRLIVNPPPEPPPSPDISRFRIQLALIGSRF